MQSPNKTQGKEKDATDNDSWNLKQQLAINKGFAGYKKGGTCPAPGNGGLPVAG